MIKLFTLWITMFALGLTLSDNLGLTTCNTDSECQGLWGTYSLLINNLGGL